MRLAVGIDPGLAGGIAALDPTGSVVGTWPMPVAGGEVHAAGVADLLRSLRCLDGHQDIGRVCLEKVGGRPRQRGVFRFGEGCGMIRGVCAALGIAVARVLPQRWKETVLDGLPHDKAGAIQYCTSRWPTAELVLPGCRVPHDGLADALCLAEYGRRLEHRS